MLTRIARLEAGPVTIRMCRRLTVRVDGESMPVFWMIVIGVDVRVQRRDWPGS